MALPVLVVDPDSELAVLIQQSLEREYGCRVALAANSSEALAAARAHELRLAIVDLDLPDLKESDLIRRLRSLQPEMAVLGLSANPSVEVGTPLGLHAHLTKPFYLPDLMARIQQMIGGLRLSADEAASMQRREPARRLADTAEAARWIARGARDSGAYLVLLMRGGRRWVHAGPMPQPHVEQVVSKILAYGIRPDAPGAVARYLRLPGAVDAFLLYCFALADDYLLAVLYPARVPFSSVRRQAERLAEMLLHPSAATSLPSRTIAQPVLAEEVVRLPHDWVPQTSSRIQLPYIEAAISSPQATPAAARPHLFPTDWLPGGTPLPVVESMIASPAAKISPPPAQPPLPAAEASAPPTDDLPPAPELPPSLVRDFLPPSPLSPARPQRTGPLSAAAAEPLRISLVYVPRDPDLALQGLLATTLVQWTKEICRSLGFTPVDIQVRADALCMTLELPPGASPPTAAHRMRQELSRCIAATYPSQAAAAASGRFWASRYLLMSGEPPSAQRITEFIGETRGRPTPAAQ